MNHIQVMRTLQSTLLRDLRDDLFRPHEWLLDETTGTLVNRSNLLVKIRLDDANAVLCYGPHPLGDVHTPRLDSVERLPQLPQHDDAEQLLAELER